MNVFLIFLIVAVLSLIGSFLGLSWLWHPRDKHVASKPFNRTIHRSLP